MSTTALHIVQLVKSLPAREQEFIRAELAREAPSTPPIRRRRLAQTGSGAYLNPDGIPNDDPVFAVLEEIEAERHRASGPAAPEFD